MNAERMNITLKIAVGVDVGSDLLSMAVPLTLSPLHESYSHLFAFT